jgi:hypothetical protein
MRFPPSVVESKHGWRTAMHFVVTDVKNRNGACVMEVASLGSRAKMRTKEGGRIRKSLGWKEVKPRPMCDSSVCCR